MKMTNSINQVDESALNQLIGLTKTYPQITEKAIIDFINSLDVQDDAVRTLEAQNGSFVNHLFSVVSGTKARQQNLMNGNVADNLRFVKDYINHNENKRQDSDLLLQQVASGVSKIAEKLYHHHHQISEIYDELCAIKNISNHQFYALEQRLNHHQAYILAQTEIDHVLSAWEAKRFDSFTPEQTLWMVCNRLYWGSFGTWLRLAQQQPHFQQQAQQMLETLEHKCIIILRQQTRRRDDQLIDRDSLLTRITAQDPILRNTLSFLSNQQTTPLTQALHHANNDDISVGINNDLPHIFSNVSLVQSMVNTLRGAH